MKKFLKAHEIKPGSIWQPCDGGNARVVVKRVVDQQVYYTWIGLSTGSQVDFDKDVFSFQVRYELSQLQPAEEPSHEK
jgi:hypothetical protein